MKGVSQKSARGSSGFSVKKLQMIPPVMLRHLFDMYALRKAVRSLKPWFFNLFVVCLRFTVAVLLRKFVRFLYLADFTGAGLGIAPLRLLNR